MEFFNNIKKSIYGPDYYTGLLQKPFSYSLKYYFLLCLLLSVLGTVVLSFSIVPKIAAFANMAAERAVSDFPAELKVTIAGGKVSTNVQEPYAIAMPVELKAGDNMKVNGAPAKRFNNLVVIDTKNSFTVEQFKSYDTAVLITKDSMVNSGENGKITINSLEKVPDVVLDKAKVAYFITKIKPFIKFVYPLVIILIFSALMTVCAFGLVYLFFGALLVWLVFKAVGVKTGYGKSYQLGMHLMTTGMLINSGILFLNLFVLHFKTIPFFFTMVLVLVAFINIKKPDQVVAI